MGDSQLFPFLKGSLEALPVINRIEGSTNCLARMKTDRGRHERGVEQERNSDFQRGQSKLMLSVLLRRHGVMRK